MKLIMQLWAMLSGGRLVWLRDHDGEVTLSISHTDPFGNTTAKRWWPYRIRVVKLMPDGAVCGGYVEEWRPA